ncbi:MAG: DNA-binding NtrC family response regulator [Myxococcota bacterium]|jgi:DNA-binding NtrC family response regulator
MNEPLSVLVVDDNRSAALAIAMLLEREGHFAEAVYDGQSAIDHLQQRTFDLVLTDLRMEPVDGLQVVAAARACDPPVDAIVFTAYGSVEAAVEAMRLGALDFLTKPVTADVIIRRVQELRKGPMVAAAIVGSSAPTEQLRQQAQKLAEVRSTVLITGEIGAGRRHLARWLHLNGPDNDRPMFTVRPGRPLDPSIIEEAGTLLLTGVDRWSDSAQSLLQQQLEGLEPGRPPRIIATASSEIDASVTEGSLRPELYFRLAVLVIAIQPLRQRRADIAPLLSHFLDLHAEAFDRPPVRPTAQQLAHLCEHGWLGNVREVANLAERAAVLGDIAFDMQIKPQPQSQSAEVSLSDGFNLSSHMEDIERALLVQAIEQTRGDRPKMTKILGLERNTLRYKLNKYKLLKR